MREPKNTLFTNGNRKARFCLPQAKFLSSLPLSEVFLKIRQKDFRFFVFEKSNFPLDKPCILCYTL